MITRTTQEKEGWLTPEREPIRIVGKERRRVVALISESFQLRNRSGCRGESAVPRSEFAAGTFQNTDLMCGVTTSTF